MNTKKSKWTVSMPIAGVVHLEVEAPDAKGAIEQFYEDISKVPDSELDMEWSFYERIADGNVLNVEWNEVIVDNS